jgi:hypothetical protein
MNHVLPSSSRALMISLVLTLPIALPAAVFAQSTAPVPVSASLPETPRVEEAPPAASGRPDKAVQRIRTEDAGTRIDEVRVGGETQSITVQPKIGTKVPPYEVKPADSSKGSAPSTPSNETVGPRVWNVLKF